MAITKGMYVPTYSNYIFTILADEFLASKPLPLIVRVFDDEFKNDELPMIVGLTA